MISRATRARVRRCVVLAALVLLAGCKGDTEDRVHEEVVMRAVAGIERGMTEREVLARLGPPTEVSTGRSFSRDSVLWELVDGSPTPVRSWSFNRTDAELSRTVAPGDTSYARTSRWADRAADWPDQSTRIWTVFLQRVDGVWRVTGSEDRIGTFHY